MGVIAFLFGDNRQAKRHELDHISLSFFLSSIHFSIFFHCIRLVYENHRSKYCFFFLFYLILFHFVCAFTVNFDNSKYFIFLGLLMHLIELHVIYYISTDCHEVYEFIYIKWKFSLSIHIFALVNLIRYF